MRIGPYSVHLLELGDFKLDGGSMHGTVPRTLWSRHSPPDTLNRIVLRSRALLLVSDGARVLVDCGLGTEFTDRQREIYGIAADAGTLERALATAGLFPAEITHVLLTHLHFDHAGGATRREGGMLIPTFPNARVLVQRRQWERAVSPGELDRASYHAKGYATLAESGRLDLLDGEGEALPGVFLHVFEGHTDAMQCPRVSDGRRSLFFCADLVPLASHLRLPYVMAFDLRPTVTVEEKKRVLARAADEGWVLVLSHDPGERAVTVRAGERGAEIARRVGL